MAFVGYLRRMEHRRRLGLALAAALLVTGGLVATAASKERSGPARTVDIPAPIVPAPGTASPAPEPPSGAAEPIRWHRSRSLGAPWAGRLVDGVQLPPEGVHYFSWDPVRRVSPNRPQRRWGTDRLIRTVLAVLDEYAAAHPHAPRVGIGDLSRPHGGAFGARYGGLGHSSHQSGLDVDVYYPRRDGREREVRNPRQIDHRLAQALVDLFVRAGAQYVFVGLHSGLSGPPRIVQAIPHHDDHLHVRIFRTDHPG